MTIVYLILLFTFSTTTIFAQMVCPSRSTPSEIEAIVREISTEKWPNSKLIIEVRQSSNTRVLDTTTGPRIITARNCFFRGAISLDPCDETNLGALAAYFLLPGDEISAKLYAGAVGGGRQAEWYICGTTRKPGSAPLETTMTPEGLQLKLALNKSIYSAGEPININLIISNITPQAQTLNFTSGQQYDFILTQKGKEVWRWSKGLMFTQALCSLTFTPGQSRTFTAIWNQVDNNGKRVSAGEYEVTGYITATEYRPAVGPVRFTIVPSKLTPKAEHE